MVSFRSILAAAASFAVVLAQTPNIAFTSVPAVAVAGSSYNISWGGGDGTPVTLTLRKGSPDNLDTIGTLASRISGTSYLWTVDESLATASDYALQITQGQNGINYSGLFSVVGGTGTSSISYSGATSRTSNGTITTQGMTITRGSASTTASAGTGTNMPRNTTFSSQSLSSTARTITSAASTSSRASATASQSTSVPASNIGTSMGSSIAMVMGLFGAIMFLQ